MIKAVVYARVSTRKQAKEDKHSLKDQVARCRQMIEDEGWTEVAKPIRETHTATTPDRPGLQRAIRMVKDGRVDKLVVWDTSRFMRNAAAANMVRGQIQLAGAEVVFVEQPPTGNEFADEVLAVVSSLTDHSENEKRKKNTMRGRKDALRKGKWIFPPPYGYRLGGGMVVVDEAESEALQLIFKLYLDGHSHQAIKAHLDSQEVTSRYGRKWNKRTFARLITNADTYASGELRVTMQGEAFTHKIPKLITRRMAAQLAKFREGQKSHRGRNAPKSNEHMFRRLLRCSCGRAWQAKKDPRTGRLYYRCPLPAGDRSKKCGRSVGELTVIDAVWPLIFDNLITHTEDEDGVINEAPYAWIRTTGTELEASRGEIESQIADAERILRGLDESRLRLDRQLMKGQTSEANHAKLNAELDGERAIAEAQLAEAEGRLAAAIDTDAWEEQAIGFVDRAAELSTTPDGRQVLVRTLIDNVLITRDKDNEPVVTPSWKVAIPGISTIGQTSGST